MIFDASDSPALGLLGGPLLFSSFTEPVVLGDGSLMPAPVFQAFDNNGRPLAGGLVYAYRAGTSTPADVYTDVGLTDAHDWPLSLDAYGRAIIYLGAGSFKFIVRTANDADVWMVDPVQATHTAQQIVGDVFLLGGDPVSPVTATSYPSGALFTACHAGTSIVRFDSGTLPSGTYVLEGMLAAAGGTITAGLVNLSDGAPDTAVVEITSTSTSGERARSAAITFPAAGSAKEFGVKVKVSAGSGFAWGLRLLRVG
jgi:hypothetical protein